MNKTYYGLEESSNAIVRCAFCDVLFPKTEKCIQDHVNGTTHLEIMREISGNAILHLENVCLFCNICKTVVPENESILEHVRDASHTEWHAKMNALIDGEFINVSGYLSNRTGTAYCEPCRTHLNCTLRSIEEHLYDPYHHINVTECLKPLNGIFPSLNHNELWCKVCDYYLKDTFPDVMAHAEFNDQHVDWFNTMESFVDDYDINLGNYLSFEYENKVYCDKCQCEILATPEMINYHINSEEHCTNNFPYIVEGDPNSLFYYNRMP